MIKRIFPDNIRYLRNKNQLSQEAMALKLDLTRSQIASYEDGRAEPNLQTLIRYSDYFKLPIDALLKNDLTMAQDGAFLDIGHHRILFPVLINEENEDLIEVVPIKASAGYLGGYGDPDYITPESVRVQRLRAAQPNLGKVKPGGYKKYFGRHEHRVVAERKLGRPLRKGEVIHHIDGNSHNNDPENIEIITQSEHLRRHWPAMMAARKEKHGY